MLTTMIFMKVSSVDDRRQLHDLFMYCCKSESAAKVVQPQHRLIPTGGTSCPYGSWDGTPRHHLTVAWLKFTGPPWMALVALQWWQAHAKYRQFQPIWTQSQHRTPICTLDPIAQVFAKTINGKLLAPPGICQLYLFQYNRCLKQTGNRQYPTAFTVYPDLKFMFTQWQRSSV